MKRILAVVIVLCAMSGLCQADDMYAAFVKFKGVNGGHKFQGTEGWIALKGLKIGPAGATGQIRTPIILFSPSNLESPPLHEIGNLNGMRIEFTKELDKISPRIANAVSRERRIPSARFCICSVRGKAQVLFELHLNGIVLKNVHRSGNRETVELTAAKLRLII